MNVYPSMFHELYRCYPLTLVDVGASGGVPPLWQPHRRYRRVIGFEPDAQAFEVLRGQQDHLTRYLNIGLHRDNGEVDRH